MLAILRTLLAQAAWAGTNLRANYADLQGLFEQSFKDTERAFAERAPKQ